MIIDSPKISILIPAYNTEAWVGKCIDSCLNQTFDDFELRIHDDGSTDHTPDIIDSYKDSRIVFTRSEKNEGTMDAVRHLDDFNAGYAVYVDSDDEIDEHLLETLLPYTKIPDVGIWPLDIGNLGADGRRGEAWGMRSVDASEPMEIWKSFKDSSLKWFRGAKLIRRDVALASIPRPDVSWIAEDRFWGPTFWLNAGHVKSIDLPRPLYWYRRHVGCWDNRQRRAAGRERSDRPEDVIRHAKEVVDLVEYHGATFVRNNIESVIREWATWVSPQWCRDKAGVHPEPFRTRILDFIDLHFTKDNQPTDYMMKRIYAAVEGCW